MALIRVAAVIVLRLDAVCLLPILRLARLAVEKRFQGQGIGRLLFRAMLEIALEMRDRIGCTGVVVNAKPQAVDFFTGIGFRPMQLISGFRGG